MQPSITCIFWDGDKSLAVRDPYTIHYTIERMAITRSMKRKRYAKGRRGFKRVRRSRRMLSQVAIRRPRAFRPQMNRLPGFPETYRTTLVYNEGITIDPAAGGTAYYSFNANSLYDPNYTGTGHQPLYYDNLTAIYGRWRVRKCYITVTVLDMFQSNAQIDEATGLAALVGGTQARLVVTRDRDAADNETTFNNIQEERSKNIKWRYISAQTNGRYPKLKMLMIPNVMLKMSKDDSSLWGSASSNATSQCFFNIGVAAVDDTTNIPGLKLNVRLTYVCDFFDRTIDQPQN